MKKIPLLFTLICVSVLTGMELESIGDQFALPRKVNHCVVGNMELYNNIDTVIEAIKADSELCPELQVILENKHSEDFKTILYILAEKFDLSPCTVARKFNTSAANTYANLCDQLREKLKSHDIAGIKQVLEKGADINGLPTLLIVMNDERQAPTAKLIKLLLKHGAYPFVAMEPSNVTALYMLKIMHNDLNKRNPKEYKKIESLLKNAMGGQ